MNTRQTDESEKQKSMYFEALMRESADPAFAAWRPVLEHLAVLRENCILPPVGRMAYPYENIGPGYCYGPAFSHWDLTFALLDSCAPMPEHCRRQLENMFAYQQPDGFLTFIMTGGGRITTYPDTAFPPVWPLAVDEYCRVVGNGDLQQHYLPNLERQIAWFETHRRAAPFGFYYLDVLTGAWESGIDESVRVELLGRERGKFPCVDATSHMFLLYDAAARWSGGKRFTEERDALRTLLQTEFFSDRTGFFHDWRLLRDGRLHDLIEGFMPLIVGAASEEQANRMIDGGLLNPERFLAPHPVPWVGLSDPAFELRMSRGPAWNSLTLSIALGCMRYRRPDAARTILARALDATQSRFADTGAVWEFYHPLGGDPNAVMRKPGSPFPTPCREYAGHNPLFAMARTWARCP